MCAARVNMLGRRWDRKEMTVWNASARSRMGRSGSRVVSSRMRRPGEHARTAGNMRKIIWLDVYTSWRDGPVHASGRPGCAVRMENPNGGREKSAMAGVSIRPHGHDPVRAPDRAVYAVRSTVHGRLGQWGLDRFVLRSAVGSQGLEPRTNRLLAGCSAS